MLRYLDYLNIFGSCLSCHTLEGVDRPQYTIIVNDDNQQLVTIDDNQQLVTKVTTVTKGNTDDEGEYYRNEINAFVIGSKMIEIDNDFIK